MSSHRSEHIGESIKRELTNIISNLKDPRLKDKNNLIFVSKINISKKNSSCKIFISTMKSYESSVEICEILQEASGYIKNQLGERLKLRYMPSLVFIPTDAIEYGASILEKINKLNINNNINNNSGELCETDN